MASALIIDENARRREMLHAIMRPRGIRVQEAACADQGLTLVSAGEFHIILMDIDPPDMDGLSLLRRIRFKERRAAILVLCRVRDIHQIRAIIEAGAVSVLDRESPGPYMREQINNVIISRSAVY